MPFTRERRPNVQEAIGREGMHTTDDAYLQNSHSRERILTKKAGFITTRSSHIYSSSDQKFSTAMQSLWPHACSGSIPHAHSLTERSQPPPNNDLRSRECRPNVQEAIDRERHAHHRQRMHQKLPSRERPVFFFSPTSFSNNTPYILAAGFRP